MLGLGMGELIVILVILLVLFGATKLPKLARSIGESAGELQKGFDDVQTSKEKPDKAAADKKSA